MMGEAHALLQTTESKFSWLPRQVYTCSRELSGELWDRMMECFNISIDIPGNAHIITVLQMHWLLIWIATCTNQCLSNDWQFQMMTQKSTISWPEWHSENWHWSFRMFESNSRSFSGQHQLLEHSSGSQTAFSHTLDGDAQLFQTAAFGVESMEGNDNRWKIIEVRGCWEGNEKEGENGMREVQSWYETRWNRDGTDTRYTEINSKTITCQEVNRDWMYLCICYVQHTTTAWICMHLILLCMHW